MKYGRQQMIAVLSTFFTGFLFWGCGNPQEEVEPPVQQETAAPIAEIRSLNAKGGISAFRCDPPKRLCEDPCSGTQVCWRICPLPICRDLKQKEQ